MHIYDYQQLTEEEKLARLPKDIQFLHRCPNFLSNKCASVNWNTDSPCWDCFKQNKYIIRQKER
jgi:hypothetical protein